MKMHFVKTKFSKKLSDLIALCTKNILILNKWTLHSHWLSIQIEQKVINVSLTYSKLNFAMLNITLVDTKVLILAHNTIKQTK